MLDCSEGTLRQSNGRLDEDGYFQFHYSCEVEVKNKLLWSTTPCPQVSTRPFIYSSTCPMENFPAWMPKWLDQPESVGESLLSKLCIHLIQFQTAAHLINFLFLARSCTLFMSKQLRCPVQSIGLAFLLIFFHATIMICTIYGSVLIVSKSGTELCLCTLLKVLLIQEHDK